MTEREGGVNPKDLKEFDQSEAEIRQMLVEVEDDITSASARLERVEQELAELQGTNKIIEEIGNQPLSEESAKGAVVEVKAMIVELEQISPEYMLF